MYCLLYTSLRNDDLDLAALGGGFDDTADDGLVVDDLAGGDRGGAVGLYGLCLLYTSGDTHLPEDVMGDRTVSARGEDFSRRGDADSRHPDQRFVIRAVYLHRIHVQMPQRPCGLRVEILL